MSPGNEFSNIPLYVLQNMSRKVDQEGESIPISLYLLQNIVLLHLNGNMCKFCFIIVFS